MRIFFVIVSLLLLFWLTLCVYDWLTDKDYVFYPYKDGKGVIVRSCEKLTFIKVYDEKDYYTCYFGIQCRNGHWYLFSSDRYQLNSIRRHEGDWDVKKVSVKVYDCTVEE